MILVTGSTGNVGSQLIPALREAGERVRALVHDESKGQPLRDIGAEVVVGDMESPETLGKAVAGVDKVYLITSGGQTGATQASSLIEAVKSVGRLPIVRQTGFGSSKSRIIQQHEEIEKLLEASGVPYTLIKPTFLYAEHDDGRPDCGFRRYGLHAVQKMGGWG